MDQFLDQKWVIFRVPRARARARARGDKIDFVLEMPCTRPCMDFPKMTHFGSLFGPQNPTHALRNRPKKWVILGVPGSRDKSGKTGTD